MLLQTIWGTWLTSRQRLVFLNFRNPTSQDAPTRAVAQLVLAQVRFRFHLNVNRDPNVSNAYDRLFGCSTEA